MSFMRVIDAAERMGAAVDQLLPRARERAPRTANHLERSVDSVIFNSAEGSATFEPAVAIYHFDIARREANEVRVALRRLVAKNVLEQDEIWKAFNLATSCMKMLRAAIERLRNPLPSAQTGQPRGSAPPKPRKPRNARQSGPDRPKPRTQRDPKPPEPGSS